MAFLKPGDKILGMSLDAGGHLTHGAKVSFSGKVYESHTYGLNSETETLDYVAKQAREVKPQMIVPVLLHIHESLNLISFVRLLTKWVPF